MEILLFVILAVVLLFLSFLVKFVFEKIDAWNSANKREKDILREKTDINIC